MATLKEKLGTRIQQIRKSKKLTQEKLAEAIGLDTPNLSNIERGKRFVSAETLEKIIVALGIEEKELFDFSHIKPREELLKEINSILTKIDDRSVEYFYRIINLQKEMEAR